MKHGRTAPPPLLLLLVLLLLLLQHKPSQGNNKQMSGVGTAPSESRQVLKRGRIAALVPRLQGEDGRPQLDCPQSLGRTGKT